MEMFAYYVPLTAAEYRMNERGSKFIGYAVPVSGAREAMEQLELRRRLHHNATHNCWALRVGEPPRILERCSDDGEPSYTAGKPIGEQIARRNIIGIMLIVSRWFGGTKLGRGGLARAYAGCAAQTLNRVPLQEVTPTVSFVLECGYEQLGTVEHLVTSHQGKIEEGTYTDSVKLIVRISLEQVDQFQKRLTEAGQGKITIRGDVPKLK